MDFRPSHELSGAECVGLLELVMNYKLSDDITDVVIEALQHFDHIDKKGMPQTLEETPEAISGGVARYRTDPIFRAKVRMLVARVTAVVREHDVHTTGTSK